MGSVSATTYSVTFNWSGGSGGSAGSALLPGPMRHIHSSFFTAPVTFIRKIEKGTPRGKEAGSFFTVDILFKDVRSWTLVFRDESLADRVVGHLRMVAFPQKVDFLHCFEEAKAIGLSQAVFNLPPAGLDASPIPTTLTTQGGVLPGWDVYNPYHELERMGVLGLKNPRTGGNLWRVSEINREYRFCPTYPSVLVFPERIPDAALRPLESFRSKARVPALTWQHPSNKTTLWRCSQPRVGMGNNVCKEDEMLFYAIKEANSHWAKQQNGGSNADIPLLIADCRPKANAMANKAGGWGYENYSTFSQLEFLGIHNIHAVRDSYKKLEALSLSANASDVNWTSAVADSGWLHHVRSVLGGAIFVAESMHRRGQSVVVHCSDGWDRTAQVCGLVQLLLDPYSRTLRGLCSLIAKEWCSFGHKFHERCGHGDEKADVDGDFSPVFIQWLDAVWQLVRLFPHAFEFNERALLVIGHHLYSCRFGTFLFNCERERVENRLAHRAQSLWAYLLHGGPARTSALINQGYCPSLGDILLPHPSAVLRSVEVWSEWFLRFSSYPSMIPRLPRYYPAAASAVSSGSFLQRLERYPQGTYDYESVAELAVVSRAWEQWRRERGSAGGSGIAGGAGAVPSAAATTTAEGGVGAARAPRPSVTRDPLTGAVIVHEHEHEAPPTTSIGAPASLASDRLVRGGILDDGSGDETPSSPEARAGAGRNLVEGVAAVLLSEEEGGAAQEVSRASFSDFVGGGGSSNNSLSAAKEGSSSSSAAAPLPSTKEVDEADEEVVTTPALTAALSSKNDSGGDEAAADDDASELDEEDQVDEEGEEAIHHRRPTADEEDGDTRATNSPAPPPSSGGYANDDE
jgi:Myotubularin-like phosphatase domain